jgi:hypothetical protein
MTTADEGLKPQKDVKEVLRAYMESIREFRLIDDAARAHLDKMLTWVIGLMGAGVLATASLGGCPRGDLVWASAPWVVGILIAVLGRLSGDLYRDHPGLRTTAEVFEAHLELARGPDEDSARAFFARHSEEPYLARADRAQRIARWCYRVSLILLAIGMLSIFRRVASC